MQRGNKGFHLDFESHGKQQSDSYQMITENKLKSNCKGSSLEGKNVYPLSAFDFNSCLFYIKYRTCVYEVTDSFMIPHTPGLIELIDIRLIHGKKFYTQMLFKKCELADIYSEKYFERWIKIRNISLFDSMLFIKQNDELFCMHNSKGPLYLPLLNKNYYSVMKQLNSK